jgi:hypothetical protein
MAPRGDSRWAHRALVHRPQKLVDREAKSASRRTGSQEVARRGRQLTDPPL